MRYLFTGDEPEIFPDFTTDTGTTLILRPGDSAELPDGVVHARLTAVSPAVEPVSADTAEEN